MARLIRTEKEVEGRTPSSGSVEEDTLDQWLEGPLDVVGSPRAGSTASSARGAASLHGRHPAAGDAARSRAAQSSRACARAASRPGAARGSPGVRRAGPLNEEIGYEGQAVAAVAADTLDQARAAVELIGVDWDVREPLLDPTRRSGGELIGRRTEERGDVERGFAEADVVVEAEYRTQTVLHNSMETHQSVCEWEAGDRLNVYISTQFIWGVRDNAEHYGLPPDHVRVVCRFMGGGFGSKNGAGDYTYIAADLARETGRLVGARSPAARRASIRATATPRCSVSRRARLTGR